MGRFKETEIDDEDEYIDEAYFSSRQLSAARKYAAEVADRVDVMIEKYRYDKDPKNWETKEALETIRAAVTDLERVLE